MVLRNPGLCVVAIKFPFYLLAQGEGKINGIMLPVFFCLSCATFTSFFLESITAAESSKQSPLADAAEILQRAAAGENALQQQAQLRSVLYKIDEFHRAMTTSCIQILKNNIGRSPENMRPNHFIVIDAIYLLGNTCSINHQTPMADEALKALLPYLTERFVVKPKTDDVPFGPAGVAESASAYAALTNPRRATEASRALSRFGPHAVSVIAKWIGEGGLGNEFDPKAHNDKRLRESYGPYLLAHTMNKAWGGIEVVRALLRQEVVNNHENITLKLYLDYFNQVYGLNEASAELKEEEASSGNKKNQKTPAVKNESSISPPSK
jgi:hypothetical protein